MINLNYTLNVISFENLVKEKLYVIVREGSPDHLLSIIRLAKVIIIRDFNHQLQQEYGYDIIKIIEKVAKDLATLHKNCIFHGFVHPGNFDIYGNMLDLEKQSQKKKLKSISK